MAIKDENQVKNEVKDENKVKTVDYQTALSPWVLYRVNGLQNIPVGRFRKRNDAQMHSLTLKRLLQYGEVRDRLPASRTRIIYVTTVSFFYSNPR